MLRVRRVDADAVSVALVNHHRFQSFRVFYRPQGTSGADPQNELGGGQFRGLEEADDFSQSECYLDVTSGILGRAMAPLASLNTSAACTHGSRAHSHKNIARDESRCHASVEVTVLGK